MSYNAQKDLVLLHYHMDRLVNEHKTADNSITFGILFQDAECEQTFESIVGTLKAGRTAKFIEWKGQMLLYPANKDVKITLSKAFDKSLYDAKAVEAMEEELAKYKAKQKK